jgi:hypothetical protein
MDCQKYELACSPNFGLLELPEYDFAQNWSGENCWIVPPLVLICQFASAFTDMQSVWNIDNSKMAMFHILAYDLERKTK